MVDDDRSSASGQAKSGQSSFSGIDPCPISAAVGGPFLGPHTKPAADDCQRQVDQAQGQDRSPIAESQLRDYQARLGKPFLHDTYLSELTSLRDQLKAGLSGAAHQPDNEEGPSVSELAEKIKTLKAANSIEATPQRVRQKHSSAEEPVTARIRRRTEAVTETSSSAAKPGGSSGRSRRSRSSPRRRLHSRRCRTPPPLTWKRLRGRSRRSGRNIMATR